VKPAGTEIEHPEAYKLVQMGCAEAVDDECRVAAGMSPEAWQRANHAYPRTAAGVLPEHFDLWDKGLMRGYTPDGKFIPGPNVQDPDYEDDLLETDEDDWDERTGDT
jgi:hypothetical protein